MLIPSNIFINKYERLIKILEANLARNEQRLVLIKAKIKTMQEQIPRIRDDELWNQAFYELSCLQREEIRVSDRILEDWGRKKEILDQDFGLESQTDNVIPLKGEYK